MKKIKIIFLLIFGIAIIPACLVEDGAPTDDYKMGPNLAGFEDKSMNMGGIANGDSYVFELPMKVIGPTSVDIAGDVTVTVSADPASTAIEGVHYKLENKTLTLSNNNNLLGLLPITLLSEGIEAPLDVSPVLILNATDASGVENILANGKPLTITLNYLCNSVLAGKYNVVMKRDGGEAVEYIDIITETGIGEYRTSEVGHWIGGLGVGTPGFTFLDVCGVLTVPGQGLVDYYSNHVEGTEPGSEDEETGVLHIVYSISSDAWSSVYDCTYTPAN